MFERNTGMGLAYEWKISNGRNIGMINMGGGGERMGGKFSMAARMGGKFPMTIRMGGLNSISLVAMQHYVLHRSYQK